MATKILYEKKRGMDDLTAASSFRSNLIMKNLRKKYKRNECAIILWNK
jgi:hypothetical protein